MRIAVAVALISLGASSLAEAAPVPSQPPPTLRRFALIASSNHGGGDRPRLRFADSDARAFSQILRNIGGLEGVDLTLLPGARRADLQRAFARLGRAVKQTRPDVRRELVVYYSGHSDEQGLLLGGDRVTYRELRKWIEEIDVDVRIAILDSCASGAMIRSRGGTKRPSFLDDASIDARGYAFLTASSASEAAQESDRIGAGFFSHYLMSALRGAADLNGDRLVTLSEAYQFAYNETLRRTQNTPVTQHPAYDFALAGKGDLVLTDLRASSARLVLGRSLHGRVFIRDAAGKLVVELDKRSTAALELGLGPGTYVVTLTSGAQIFEAKVSLKQHEVTRLARAQMRASTRASALARGAAPEAPGVFATAIGETSLVGQTRELGGYGGLSFRYTRLGGTDGFLATIEAALLINRRYAFAFIAGGGTSAALDSLGSRVGMGFAALGFRYQVRFDSPLVLTAGVMGGAGGMSIDRDDGTSETGDYDGSFFLFEPQLGAHLEITRFLRLGIDIGHRSVAGARDEVRESVNGITSGFNVQVGWL